MRKTEKGPQYFSELHMKQVSLVCQKAEKAEKSWPLTPNEI